MEQDDPAEALRELREQRLGALELLQLAAGSGLAAYAVWALVLQPGFRRVPLRLQVPYVGASARQVEHVLSLLRGRPGKTVDLGSGDGRIVLAAHRCGLRPAVGYELNPWLVALAQLHAWRAGCAGSVCYRREDLWKVSLRDCHNVSVFLAPSVVGLGFVTPLGSAGHTSVCLLLRPGDQPSVGARPGPAGYGQLFSVCPQPPLPGCSLPQLPLLEDKLQAELPPGARVVSGRFPLPTWQPVAVVGEGLDRVWAYDVHGGQLSGKAVSCGVPIKASPGPSSTSVPGAPVSQAG
uniref:Adenine nucleotide translocase lysine methyltransferase n=1 Tax=Microcebus murinus TaxID=30608 RepID=A0A8C5XW72_MICMU